MSNPCYKCEKRHDKCHAHCQDYIDFDKENQERRAKRLKESKELADIICTISRIRAERKKK